MMKTKNNNIINSFIKNKLLNEFIDNNKFLKSQEEDTSELLHVIENEGELWVSIHIESFFKEILKKNKKTVTSFVPFFLIPVKINNILKINEEENNKKIYLKLNSIEIYTVLYKDTFYIKNTIESEKIKEQEQLLIIDTKREIKYIFSKKDKKEFIKELKVLKLLDSFNIFKIKKLIFFIEERIKEYIKNKNNFFIFSSVIDNEMIDLKTGTIKKEFSKTKPLSLSIRDEKIILNVNED